MLSRLESNPFAFTPTVILISTTVFVYLIIYFNGRRKDKRSLPPFAPVGILETIQNASGPNFPWFLRDMVHELGSSIFRLRLPGLGLYIVGDPTIIRDILMDKKSDKAEKSLKGFNFIAGHKSLGTRKNDRDLKASRKGTSHAFSSSEVNRMNQICSHNIEQWIKNRLEPCIDNNDSFDPSDEMCCMTFRIIMESAFEYTELADEEYEHFTHHLDLAVKYFLVKYMNPLRKFLGPLLSGHRIALKSCAEVQAFTRKILNAYRKNTNKSASKTIIRMIVENEHFTTDKERIAELFIMIFAGYDTTGHTLGTTLTLVAKHPEVSEKLRNELLPMNIASRPNSDYLRNVITESMRLLPVAAVGSLRLTGRDFLCNDGATVIPKGVICFLTQIIPNRSEKVFKDPDCFCPERWESADKAMREAVIPFSLGTRNCIGQSLAKAELYSVLPKLFAEYKFEVEDEGKLDYFLTLKYVGVHLKPSRP